MPEPSWCDAAPDAALVAALDAFWDHLGLLKNLQYPKSPSVALELEALDCFEADDAGGGSSNKAQVEQDFCWPWGRKPMERKVTGDGILVPLRGHGCFSNEATQFIVPDRQNLLDWSKWLLEYIVKHDVERPRISAVLVQLDILDSSSLRRSFSCSRSRRNPHRPFLQVYDSPGVEDASENGSPKAKRFRGVRYRCDRKVWVAEMRLPNKFKRNKIWFGNFESEDQAARAVDAAVHHYGKQGQFNFADSPQILLTQPSPVGLNEEKKLKLVKERAKWLAMTMAPTRLPSSTGSPSSVTADMIPDPTSSQGYTAFPTISSESFKLSYGNGDEGAVASTPMESLVYPHVELPHVQAVLHSRDLQPESNSKYALSRKRSCDAIDEDGLMSRLAPSIRKQVEDATKHYRCVPINDDDLISRLAPSIRREVEEALSSTLRPLVSALRSREEDEQKHREKLLALETQKLALKRAKLLLERLRVARCLPHRRASSLSGNRVKKNPTAR